MNTLVIVAHPDDEILNMGGTLHYLSRLEGDMTIVSVTRDIEHGRDSQFIQVCNKLYADPIQLGYEMGKRTRWNEEDLSRQLTNVFKQLQWDCVFTHNKVGEYGNFQHQRLNEIVMAISPWKTYTFGHQAERVDWKYDLAHDDLEFKVEAAGIYKKKTKALFAYDFFHVTTETFCLVKEGKTHE